VVVIEAAGETTLRHLKEPAPRRLLREVFRELTGAAPEVEVRLRKAPPPDAPSGRDRSIEDEPIFRKAREIFRENE
jgi:hypothetical protein